MHNAWPEPSMFSTQINQNPDVIFVAVSFYHICGPAQTLRGNLIGSYTGTSRYGANAGVLLLIFK